MVSLLIFSLGIAFLTSTHSFAIVGMFVLVLIVLLMSYRRIAGYLDSWIDPVSLRVVCLQSLVALVVSVMVVVVYDYRMIGSFE